MFFPATLLDQRIDDICYACCDVSIWNPSFLHKFLLRDQPMVRIRAFTKHSGLAKDVMYDCMLLTIAYRAVIRRVIITWYLLQVIQLKKYSRWVI